MALDNNVFNKLGDANESPKTTQELANPSMDSGLLRRLLRHLAIISVVREAGADLWAPTRHTEALRHRSVSSAIDYVHDVAWPSFMGMPDYLASIGYRNPTDYVGNWQFAMKSEKSYFDWLLDHPAAQESFTNLMIGDTFQTGSWLDIYPTENLLQTADNPTALLVDVGKLWPRQLYACSVVNVAILHFQPRLTRS